MWVIVFAHPMTMFSRLFGSKKQSENTVQAPAGSNWSFLKTDMHSHLIPGIDDGAPTVDDSMQMVRALQAMGYERIITTPHIKSDIYPNDPAIIQNGLKELQHALTANNIHIPVKAAAEYYVDERFMDMLERGELLTLQNKEVLIEFSFVFEPVRLYEMIFRIQTKGYRPVIAHPERYNYFHEKPSMYRDLKERGCLLQLNALSVTGYYGKPVKETAQLLLKEQLYDYCGTDMHHMRHAAGMEQLIASNIFHTLYHYPFINNRIGF